MPAPKKEPVREQVIPPAMTPPPMQQMPQPPAGFSGMQQSIMEEPTGAPQMPAPPMQQQMPQQQMPQMPAPPPIPIPKEEKPEPEEEIATLQEPQLPIAQLAYNRTNIEEIESLIESVVEEKWRQAMQSFEDFNLWKEKARVEIISIKQELLRVEQRFENMEKAMIGKVHDYDKNILNVGAEIKAVEKVLSKILQPLSQNIRELEIITKKLKK